MTSRTVLVGAVDQHDDLLRGRRGSEDARFGQDLEPDRRRGRRVVLGPFLDPVVQEFEALGIAGQPQAAFVRNLPQRLPQDEAGLGGHRVDSAAGDLVRKDRKILVGKVAAQAQPEAALAGRRAVAGARVAARLAE